MTAKCWSLKPMQGGNNGASHQWSRTVLQALPEGLPSVWQLVQKPLCHWCNQGAQCQFNTTAIKWRTCADYEEDFHTLTVEEVTMGEESHADLGIVVHGWIRQWTVVGLCVLSDPVRRQSKLPAKLMDQATPVQDKGRRLQKSQALRKKSVSQQKRTAWALKKKPWMESFGPLLLEESITSAKTAAARLLEVLFHQLPDEVLCTVWKKKHLNIPGLTHKLAATFR